MDYEALYQHVRDLFGDHWSDNAATPILFANEAEDGPPRTPVADTDPAYPARWIEVELLIGQAEFLTFADSEIDGAVRLTIWVQEGSGEKKLFGLLKDLRTLFATYGDSAGGVQFMEPLLQDAFFLEDASFYGRECLVPFTNFQDR